MKDPEREDAELIKRFLQSRTEEAFSALYRRHTPALYLFALRLAGGKRADAEDVVQETWIRALRKLAAFRQDSKLRNWLLGIASNCWRELQRASGDQRTAGSEVVEENSTTVSGDLESCIRALPDGCREIFTLHTLYGYTHEEIAGLLRIHAGTSKSQLYEARKKLRAMLQGEKQ